MQRSNMPHIPGTPLRTMQGVALKIKNIWAPPRKALCTNALDWGWMDLQNDILWFRWQSLCDSSCVSVLLPSPVVTSETSLLTVTPGVFYYLFFSSAASSPPSHFLTLIILRAVSPVFLLSGLTSWISDLEECDSSPSTNKRQLLLRECFTL